MYMSMDEMLKIKDGNQSLFLCSEILTLHPAVN